MFELRGQGSPSLRDLQSRRHHHGLSYVQGDRYAAPGERFGPHPSWIRHFIVSGKLASGKLASGKLASGKLASGKLASGKLASGKLASGNLASGNLASGNLASGNLARVTRLENLLVKRCILPDHAFQRKVFLNILADSARFKVDLGYVLGHIHHTAEHISRT